MILTLCLSLAVAADPPPKSDTVRNALKDAVSGAAQAAGGEAAPKPAGPDVARMPFTPESIKKVMAFYQPQIQGCYEETLASKKKAVEGTLNTAFVITGEGGVKNAKILKKGSSLRDETLHGCVVAVLSSMSFPKPPDGADHPIEFPFNLKAIH